MKKVILFLMTITGSTVASTTDGSGGIQSVGNLSPEYNCFLVNKSTTDGSGGDKSITDDSGEKILVCYAKDSQKT